MDTKEYTYTFCIATDVGMFTLSIKKQGRSQYQAKHLAKIEAKQRAKDCFGSSAIVGSMPKYKAKVQY